tara:strand:- start:3803 stop:4999 length:1197 start_codon:yes stop_codon:yes gene_type:complete
MQVTKFGKYQSNRKDKSTVTDNEMQDILRTDLSTEIQEFSVHVQNKIERLDERMRFVNYKFEDVRFWFRRYSISIIYLATILTLIEALLNSLDLQEIVNPMTQNVIKFTPLILSSLVSLIAAIIKFNKYEEKIEDITRATEKCIITIAKLKEVKEELYFCKTVENFLKINDRFTRDIYTEYLESNTNIERQLLDTDYAKYMKKVANNDVKRAKILLQRNYELDNIRVCIGNSILPDFLKKHINSEKPDDGIDGSSEGSEQQQLLSIDLPYPHSGNTKIARRLSLSAQHNSSTRPVPYRGTSPPPVRSNIVNKKLRPYTCKNCSRNYMLELDSTEQRCPYCKTEHKIRNSFNNLMIETRQNDIEQGLSPKRDIEHFVTHIQSKWRGYKARTCSGIIKIK